MAQQVLKNLVEPGERRVSIENIQRAVCQEFGLTVPQLRSRNNSHPIAYPRQVAMYLAKELTMASLPQIGREFGGKHHTTVLHSINKISQLRQSDRHLNRLLNKLRDSLS
jgi:chromosomal replication initiator protein